jgi:hypothetical protein
MVPKWSNDQWTVVGGGCRGAQVACLVERTLIQPIDPYTVAAVIDRCQQLSFETNALNRIADHLEHGLLHSVPDPLTDLGYPSEPALSRTISGAYVIGDQ